MRWVVAILLTVAGSGLQAETNKCAQRDHIVSHLAQKFSESLTAAGVQQGGNDNSVIEVWTSHSTGTGTFTVMLTHPNGIACIIATGTDWFETAPRGVPG